MMESVWVVVTSYRLSNLRFGSIFEFDNEACEIETLRMKKWSCNCFYVLDKLMRV